MKTDYQTVSADECLLCGGTVVLVTEPIVVKLGVRRVTLEATHRKCEACGETFHSADEDLRLRQLAVEAVRLESGVLSPDEVRQLRKQYGVSQPFFEQLINAGPKSFARWEAGTVCQSGPADTLLRVLRDVPQAWQYLIAERGLPAGVEFFGAGFAHVFEALLPRRVVPAAQPSASSIASAIEHLLESVQSSSGGARPIPPELPTSPANDNLALAA